MCPAETFISFLFFCFLLRCRHFRKVWQWMRPPSEPHSKNDTCVSFLCRSGTWTPCSPAWNAWCLLCVLIESPVKWTHLKQRLSTSDCFLLFCKTLTMWVLHSDWLSSTDACPLNFQGQCCDLFWIFYFFFSQKDGMGTDFLKNAITYSQTEGLGNDLWRMDDVSFSFTTV